MRAVRLLSVAALAALIAACHQQQSAGTSAPAAEDSQGAPPAVQTVTTVAPPASGHAEAGAVLARQGLPAAGVAPCSSCHGANGEGNAAAAFPALAAQPAAYLQRQLQSYADGSRSNALMMPVAKALDPQQRADVAAYFASLDNTGSKASGNAEAAPSDNSRGAVLSRLGDQHLRVQACANCHGPQGAGEPPGYPYLAGQNPKYLSAALQAWGNGQRNTDPSGQMPALAKALSDSDIAALAQYFAALPRPAAGQWSAAAPPQVGPPGPGSQAAGAGGNHAGGDTEQTAPLSGGSQGPGGGGSSDNATTPGQSRPPK